MGRLSYFRIQSQPFAPILNDMLCLRLTIWLGGMAQLGAENVNHGRKLRKVLIGSTQEAEGFRDRFLVHKAIGNILVQYA